MKSICLFFQVHQPLRHRRYRFFDIGNESYYYDDYANETTIQQVVRKSYLPANELLLELSRKWGKELKVAFSITGTALDQFELYAPEVIESFQKLSETGCVEFLAETYSHSLASLKDPVVFEDQVKRHQQKTEDLFGQTPRIFRNTEMIYSDDIGAQVAEMGYRGMLTEGARHVLGWKSPNFIYANVLNPRLKIFMRNFRLSDDITFRFSNGNWSEYPLTAEKFAGWLTKTAPKEEVVNLFLNYESLGVHQPKETGIFAFFESLVRIIAGSNELKFNHPTEVLEEVQPVSVVSVPHPISWADEERDLTIWMGNEMQNEALGKLYELAPEMEICHDPELIKDWDYLQTSNHFYFMSTKFFSGGEAKGYFNPFDSPYEAFINYMNILSDFKIRLLSASAEEEQKEDVQALHHIIHDQNQQIKKMNAELARLRKPTSPKKTGRKKK